MQTLLGPMLVLFGSVCFSVNGTMRALMPVEAGALSVTFIRMGLACVLLAIWCTATHKWPKSFRTFPIKLQFAYALALLCYQYCFFSAIPMIGVAVTTVVAIGFTPVATVFFSYLFYKTRPPKVWFFATPLAVLGIILVNDFQGQAIQWVGVFLPIFAALCYGFNISIAKVMMRDIEPEAVICIITGMIAAMVFPFVFVGPMAWILEPQGLGASLGIGVIAGGLAFAFLFAGMRRTEPAVTSTLSLAEPIGAVMWGVLLLGEALTAQAAVGVGLVLLAIAAICVTQLMHTGR